MGRQRPMQLCRVGLLCLLTKYFEVFDGCDRKRLAPLLQQPHLLQHLHLGQAQPIDLCGSMAKGRGTTTITQQSLSHNLATEARAQLLRQCSRVDQHHCFTGHNSAWPSGFYMYV